MLSSTFAVATPLAGLVLAISAMSPVPSSEDSDMAPLSSTLPAVASVEVSVPAESQEPYLEPTEIVSESEGFVEPSFCPEEDPESCPPQPIDEPSESPTVEPSGQPTAAPTSPTETPSVEASLIPATSTEAADVVSEAVEPPSPATVTTAPAELARTGLETWHAAALGALLLLLGGACLALRR